MPHASPSSTVTELLNSSSAGHKDGMSSTTPREDAPKAWREVPIISTSHHFADSRIQQVLELVEGPGGSLLAIEEIAAKVNLSRSRFEHLFRRETGVTIGRTLRTVRLNLAKRLLAYHALRVKEVASSCGYACTQDLTRAFKCAFGSSPSEYRRSING